MVKKSSRYRSVIAFSFLIVFSALGCSMQTMAIRTTGGILEFGVESINEEEDIVLAEQAIMANLKMLEALIKGDPKNKQLLVLVTQGYAGYALAFVEDEYPKKAKMFYNRAKDYGMRALKQKKAFRQTVEGKLEDFEAALKKFNIKDVPALFWTANSWGNWINLSRDSPSAIVQMGRVELMMKRILELDESYFYGGVHMFYSVYYGGRSRMFGGNPEKAKRHFDKFIKLSEGKFMIGKVLFAQYYAVQMQDDVLFKRLLNETLDAPGDVLPEQRLVNEVAKVKAAALLDDMDSFF